MQCGSDNNKITHLILDLVMKQKTVKERLDCMDEVWISVILKDWISFSRKASGIGHRRQLLPMFAFSCPAHGVSVQCSFEHSSVLSGT